MRQPNRLRIAFVADSLHTLSGGVLSGKYVVERLRQEHDVITVAADGDEALPSFTLPIRAMREMRFVMARPDRAILSRAFQNVDVVHLQLPFWLSFTALEEARRAGLPVVAGFHVQPENAYYNVGIHSTWLNDATYRFLIRRFYDRVDTVICPTPFAEERLRAHGLRAPAVVVSNGVPPDVAAATAVPHAPRPDDGQDRPFFILAIGRLGAEKRQDVIIEAVRRSRHRDRIRLALTGAGPREDELKELARNLPNGAEIGFASRDELLHRLATADLFIHASEVELEGMAVLEAMSAGLPAVIAQAPESAASRFALNDDFAFPAGDAGALAQKIDALIDAPQKLEAARAAYRERARQFDFGASVGKLVDVYRRVIDAHRARPRKSA
ncbi:MAG: glycosyltransferase [Polyangiaceae bacterium]|nr:glycosyltransferase [Polyangiaceae bacterium]